MRIPATHILLTDFITVMGKFDIDEKTAKRIFVACAPYNIKNRYMVSGNATLQRKARKAIAAESKKLITVARFNLLLNEARRTAGHRHITPIRTMDSLYQTLKEVATLACEFCESVGLHNYEEGCKVYINLGLNFMKRSSQYALGKFKFYNEKIYQAYDSYDMIHNDPDPNLTREFHDIYVELLAEYAGITRDVSSKPEDYVNFVYAKLDAQSVNTTADIWIQAQFEVFRNWNNTLPNINQLFGDSAINRFYRFVGTPIQDDVITVTTEKPMSDFDKKYQENLRKKYSE